MSQIDPTSHTPKKIQLAGIIRARILSGDLASGQDLPSERTLGEQYGVGMTTVKDALMALRQEGLVMSERGRPWWVRPVRANTVGRYLAAQDNYQPDQESRFAAEHGVPWSRFRLGREYRVIPAPERVARELQLAPGALVCERLWTHATDDAKLRVAYSYLDMSKFADTILTDVDEPPWPGGTIAQLHSLGYAVSNIVEDVGIAHPDELEAEFFGLQRGERVLEKWRTQYVGHHPGQRGVPVETARHVYPERAVRLVYEVGVNNRARIDWNGGSPD